MSKVLNSTLRQATQLTFLSIMLWNGLSSSSQATSIYVMYSREYILSADFKLPTIESPKRNLYKKQPINIHFEIPFFTVSGFQVRYLKIVDRSGYKASPWVKYLTKNGEYQIRMNWWYAQYCFDGLYLIVLSWEWALSQNMSHPSSRPTIHSSKAAIWGSSWASRVAENLVDLTIAKFRDTIDAKSNQCI